ncbi:hypothetical protein ACS0TY_019983 [Phlomoides rotata]
MYEGSGYETGGKRDDSPRKIINLDLGIGSSNERGLKRIKQENKPLFTAAQFLELYNQILVYNSITLGLPLPFHLLLPLWMSVFNSLGPAIYKKYPSFAEFNPQKPDYSSAMDSEPGRCRRTDGRKWRCSKEVVPEQKYCERHMHRGRQCSRKHVESIKSVSRPYNLTSVHNKMPTISSVTPDMDDKITVSSFQSDLGPTQIRSNYRIGVPAFVKYRGDEKRDANQMTVHAFTVGDEVNKNINVGYTASTSSNSKSSFGTNEGNHAEGKSSSDEANTRRVESWKQSGVRNSCEGFVSSRFGLSPKSVLHSAAGKVSQGVGKKNAKETEAQRCRRTDGKKWQCKRGALQNQKYCESHMHRGAKKLVLSPQSVNNSRRNLDNGINLNTVPMSPQHTTGNNSTSSMSDATTITDENIN